jgi:hypothetical protein
MAYSKRNPVGIAAGVAVIISVFLPWGEIPILGGANLIDVTRFVRGVGALAGSEGVLLSWIFVAIVLLVLGGGIVGLFRSKAGGGMAIAGLLTFTILVVALQLELEQALEAFGFGTHVDLFAFAGIGYWVGWVGAIVAVFANKIARPKEVNTAEQ